MQCGPGLSVALSSQNALDILLNVHVMSHVHALQVSIPIYLDYLCSYLYEIGFPV
jgi:hypothetical protein